MDGIDMYYKVLDTLGTETLLEELFYAMSIDELEDKMGFIAKNHDIDLSEDGEEE